MIRRPFRIVRAPRVRVAPPADAATLLAGDCLAVLPTLADNSIDACVTDPPYHLTSIVNRFAGATAGGTTKIEQDAGNRVSPYGRASSGFMSKRWDGGDIAFRPDVWREVYRVLKPGAHLVAFGGTRTYHRMACAIEDAGFEIRDCLQWIYGSGFPKSHDVSKGIAKPRTEDIEPWRVVCRFIRAAMDAQGLKSRHLVQHFGGCDPRLIDHWAARDTDSQPALPTLGQYATLTAVLALGPEMDAEVQRLNARKGTTGAAWSEAEVTGEHVGVPGGVPGQRFSVRDNLVRRVDGVAAEWQGWGTALKPACELIVMARKPLSEGTVAANVLKWGTGAINIDGCRVEGRDRTEYGLANATRTKGDVFGEPSAVADFDASKGRWPANVIHDGSQEVLDLFPSPHGAGAARAGQFGGEYDATSYDMSGAREMGRFGDTGSAARFFYNTSESDSAARRFVYAAKANKAERRGSKHPTVKPIKLLRYLARLITPPGGIILDPFAGTGTTGEAAHLENFRVIMIEREEEYLTDIRRRMSAINVTLADGKTLFAKVSGFGLAISENSDSNDRPRSPS